MSTTETKHTKGEMFVKTRNFADCEETHPVLVIGNLEIAAPIGVVDDPDRDPFDDPKALDLDVNFANARRLALCWNFLINVPTEQLEKLIHNGITYRAE